MEMIPSSLLIFLVVTINPSHGRPKQRAEFIGGKILEYLKSNEWFTEKADAKVTGNVSLDIKYNIPLDLKFPLPEKTLSDCYAIKRTYGSPQSGVYTISPNGISQTKAYCDMVTTGGGWTVFQKRQDGTIDFYRTWQEYKTGFGDPAGEYWLGNDNLYELTNRIEMCELYIVMESWKNVLGYARYGNFSIEDESNSYRLNIGNYTGNAGQDSLRYHNKMKFTTKDNDNDLNANNCATTNDHGAWWYDSCDQCGLNGLYNDTTTDKGIEWDGFPGGSTRMKFTMMMLRCRNRKKKEQIVDENISNEAEDIEDAPDPPAWTSVVVFNQKYFKDILVANNKAFRIINSNTIVLQKDNQTIAARWSRPMAKGKHVFEIVYPSHMRSEFAAVGIGTRNADLQIDGSALLIGKDENSWGVDLKTRKVMYNGDVIGKFPSGFRKKELPDRFYLYLDLDSGSLMFGSDGMYYGPAICNLDLGGRMVYLMVSAKNPGSAITVVYRGRGKIVKGPIHVRKKKK